MEQYEKHTQMQKYSAELNKIYLDKKALWQVDYDWEGFQWIDPNDNDNSIVSFMRRSKAGEYIIAVSNFTPEVREGYRLGVPERGAYVELFNSDLEEYGGSGVRNEGELKTQEVGWHGRDQSIEIRVPPLATIYLKKSE